MTRQEAIETTRRSMEARHQDFKVCQVCGELMVFLQDICHCGSTYATDDSVSVLKAIRQADSEVLSELLLVEHPFKLLNQSLNL